MEFYSSVWNPPKIFLLLKKRISEPFLQKKIGENRSDRNFVKWDNFKGFHTLSSTMYYVKGVCVWSSIFSISFTPSAWKMAGRKLLSGLGSHSILLLGNEPLPMSSHARTFGLETTSWLSQTLSFLVLHRFDNPYLGKSLETPTSTCTRTNIYPLTFTKRFFLWIRKQKT